MIFGSSWHGFGSSAQLPKSLSLCNPEFLGNDITVNFEQKSNQSAYLSLLTCNELPLNNLKLLGGKGKEYVRHSTKVSLSSSSFLSDLLVR